MSIKPWARRDVESGNWMLKKGRGDIWIGLDRGGVFIVTGREAENEVCGVGLEWWLARVLRDWECLLRRA